MANVKIHTDKIRTICDALDADIGEDETTLLEYTQELADEVRQISLIGFAWSRTVHLLQQISHDVQKNLKQIRPQ